ncbi:nucleotidyltransferase family protein [Candidatus Woesearchaeota archaeon]|nr:nucleotidyltransferase family protein [Candidatus Woesearchaeota archaeon]
MKVVILAGGLAKRMRPLTDDIPKAMLDLNGKPFIQHQIEHFAANGFTDFIFCVGHLKDKIKNYFKDGSQFGINIEYSEEQQLLGTAGAVRLAADKIKGAAIVINGDNFTTMDFGMLLKFHESSSSEFTVVVAKVPAGKTTSSVLKLVGSKVVSFIEKPAREQFGSDSYYSKGIYVISPSVIKLIPETMYDFGKDLIPALVKQNAAYGYVSEEFFREIGRPEKYRQLKEEMKDE